MKRAKLIILLVDDDEKDIFFVTRATKASPGGHTVYPVQTVPDAISYLKSDGKFADRRTYPVPNVVLLDLKMPGMDGFDMLEWMRSHPEFSIIPMIVYSSSALESDVQRAYTLGANAYLQKPQDLTDLIEMIHLIYEFWSRCETPLPRHR